MDVCPVGAITTRDYRFKSRPWDNPEAVDTICTLCEKGCNTTAWIKAKPEWAKGAQLIRTTPRFNPDVNDYWMCDIGRFDYRWIEGDERLQRPLVRDEIRLARAHGLDDRDRHACAIASRRSAILSAIRFFVSAHASLEELFLIGRLGGSFGLPEQGVAISWRYREKPQPPNAKFKIPPVDAPNVNGARDLGFPVSGHCRGGQADISAFRAEVEQGRVKALYVFDPGPDGSIGDVSWIIEARRDGRLPLLIVQGVLMTALAQAADIVLPGASWVEKDACLRERPGPAAGGVPRDRSSGRGAGGLAGVRERRPGARRPRRRTRAARQVRADLAAALTGNERYAGLANARVRATGHGKALAPGLEPVRAMEVGLHVPGSAAGQIRGHAARAGRAGTHPRTEGGLTTDVSRMIVKRFLVLACHRAGHRCWPTRSSRRPRADVAPLVEGPARAGSPRPRRAESHAARRAAHAIEQAARPIAHPDHC